MIIFVTIIDKFIVTMLHPNLINHFDLDKII